CLCQYTVSFFFLAEVGIRARNVTGVQTCALPIFGHAVVGTLHLALYLDMIGTAVSAIVLGPWYGVAVAVLGTATGTLIHGTMAQIGRASCRERVFGEVHRGGLPENA